MSNFHFQTRLKFGVRILNQNSFCSQFSQSGPLSLSLCKMFLCNLRPSYYFLVKVFKIFVVFLYLQEIPLKEGSKIVEVWKKPPINPYLKLYFFNVTNPRRFLKGNKTKPILREVGPFVYE